jgi:hypothetical protein
METQRFVSERDAKGRIKAYKYLVDGKEVPENQKYCPICCSILCKTKFSSRGTACKECANKKARDYYERVKHDAKWIENRNVKARKDGLAKKLRAIEHMGGVCQDCKCSYPPPVFDFHHLDPLEKELNLGDIMRRKDFSTIEKELSKCVLLCANCHRIRHFEGGLNEVRES